MCGEGLFTFVLLPLKITENYHIWKRDLCKLKARIVRESLMMPMNMIVNKLVILSFGKHTNLKMVLCFGKVLGGKDVQVGISNVVPCRTFI